MLANLALTLLLGSGPLLATEQKQTVPDKKSENAFKKMEILQPGERVVLNGEIFYSKPLRFDYDRDGTKNRVVMASKFFIKRLRDGGYNGYLQRYLYDIDKQKAVTWYAKKNMLSEPPIGIDTEVSNVKQEGKTITFDVGNWHFTMTDGGKGYLSDKIIVNDGIRTKQVTMYGGEVEVFE
jgi:hypothetical protein